MNTISNKSKADSKARFLVLIVALCTWTLTVRFQDHATTCANIQRLETVERDARQFMRLSIRMYRFYKLTTAAQAQSNVH